MPVLGIRAFTDGFSYVVLDGSQGKPKVITRSHCTIPTGLDWAESLSWIRRQVEEVLARHKVQAAALKAAEPNAQRQSPKRLHIEGVLQEAIASLAKVPCRSLTKRQIQRATGFQEKARYVGRILGSAPELKGLDSNTYSEAALAGIASLPR